MVEVLLRTIDRGDGPGKSFQIGDDGDCFGAGGFGLVPNLLQAGRDRPAQACHLHPQYAVPRFGQCPALPR